MSFKIITAWFLVFIALSLTGCVSAKNQSFFPADPDYVVLDQAHSLGQTFTARRDGLNAISIYLKPENRKGGTVTLHLRASPTESEDLRTAVLDLERIGNKGLYPFSFPAIKDSNSRDFFFFLQLEGSSELYVATLAGSAYDEGSLYINDQAVDSQVVFGMSYDRLQKTLGLMQDALGWLYLLIISFFIYVIPGWALLSFLFIRWGSLTVPEKLGLSFGMSVAIYPIFILWTHLVGLQLGSAYAWLPPLIGIVAIIWRTRGQISLKISIIRSQSMSQNLRSSGVISGDVFFNLSYIFIVGMIFFSRFWAIHDLDLPLWGDSYQHTMITQLIIDNKGLFQSWMPYAELASFTYHFGFHALSAVLHWLTALDAPKSVLWTGQIMNGLAVVGLYPLAIRIGKNRWGALATVLVAGLLLSMPMFYTNWGRYTQLAGQVILPAAIWLMWEALEDSSVDKKLLLLIALALAGLALTHYRILILALGFFPALLILDLKKKTFRVSIKKIIYIGFGALIITLPWLIRSFSGALLGFLSRRVSHVAPVGADLGEVNFIFLMPLYVWLLLFMVVIWGLLRRERAILTLIIWWGTLLLLVNPQWIGIPGSGIIKNFTLFIAIYIPAALIFGVGIGWLIEVYHNWRFKLGLQWEQETARIFEGGLAVIFLIIALAGAKARQNDIKIRDFSLATRPDLRAAQWIDVNLSPKSRFLVNSFSAFNGEAVVGSDGGWWLPLIAGRLTTLPPINYVFERGSQPDYYEQTNELVETIDLLGVDDPFVLDMLKDQNVDYVYIGQKQGGVNSKGKHLELNQIIKSVHFQTIYHQDRVWIFEIKP